LGNRGVLGEETQLKSAVPLHLNGQGVGIGSEEEI